MNRQAILDRLHAEAPALKRKYAVKSLAVFGSMARGDDHEGSDVDILVTFEGPATFDNFMGLKLDLEDRWAVRSTSARRTRFGPRCGRGSRRISSMSRKW